MDPAPTLAEVNRILNPGGVFATVDCDWPPVCTWQAEKANQELFQKINALEASDPDLKQNYVRWDKKRHLETIRASGFFRYCREIVFASRERCDAARFLSLAQSQGGVQNIQRTKPGLIEAEWAKFEKAVRQHFGDRFGDIDFAYRMRVAVK